MAVKVVIHTSASKFGNAALITLWHSLPPPSGRGWSTIGYGYVILNGWLSKDKFHPSFNGHIETGRPIDGDRFLEYDEHGAHVAGHNDSVGICLIGESGSYTTEQIATLRELIDRLRLQYGEIEVYQHSDFDKKKPYCAGLPEGIMNDLRQIRPMTYKEKRKWS
ncbi:MAG: hypothetical protein WC961_07135 [Anaerovoracaceae bacterium]